jgi:hypothetical protein
MTNIHMVPPSRVDPLGLAARHTSLSHCVTQGLSDSSALCRDRLVPEIPLSSSTRVFAPHSCCCSSAPPGDRSAQSRRPAAHQNRICRWRSQRWRGPSTINQRSIARESHYVLLRERMVSVFHKFHMPNTYALARSSFRSDRPYALLVLARYKPLGRQRAHMSSKLSQLLSYRLDAAVLSCGNSVDGCLRRRRWRIQKDSA